MEQWLVISNCQTVGLSNCLQAQAINIQITGVDAQMFKSDPDRFNFEMGKYSTLFIDEGTKSLIASPWINDIPNHVALPVVIFRAFHPDIVYLLHDGVAVEGAAHHYHSAIVYACFRAGMSIKETISRFNGNFMERCGYMNMWLPERDRLVEEFSGFGIDIAAQIRTWGRHGAFMHSINHPRIHVLHDIAAELLRARGCTPFPGSVMPHDNLAAGALFAVYPEIGEVLGVAGSYVFKDIHSYRPVDLKGFITGSFECYERIGRGSIVLPPDVEPHIDHIARLL